jgi:hypothetical protein
VGTTGVVVKVEFALGIVHHSRKAVTVIKYCAVKAYGGLMCNCVQA